MKNIEKAFKFLAKNWIITIPTVIACVIINILVGVLQLLNFFSTLNLFNFNQLDHLNQNQEYIQSMNYLIPIYVMAFAISIFSVIVSFVYYPIMAGLVHESMSKNRIINIRDLFKVSKEALYQNIKKYVKFFFANLLIGFIFIVILIIVITIFVMLFIATGTTESGVAIALLLLLAFVLVIVILALSIVYGAFTSMWFQSIIVDEYKVFDAFKVCFEILKRRFWYLMGMYLLTALISFLASSIVAGFSLLPIIGWVITGCVTGMIAMFSFVFYMYMYYENRPNLKLINTQQIENNEGIQY